jgi:hypothetical protein
LYRMPNVYERRNQLFFEFVPTGTGTGTLEHTVPVAYWYVEVSMAYLSLVVDRSGPIHSI